MSPWLLLLASVAAAQDRAPREPCTLPEPDAVLLAPLPTINPRHTALTPDAEVLLGAFRDLGFADCRIGWDVALTGPGGERVLWTNDIHNKHAHMILLDPPPWDKAERHPLPHPAWLVATPRVQAMFGRSSAKCIGGPIEPGESADVTPIDVWLDPIVSLQRPCLQNTIARDLVAAGVPGTVAAPAIRHWWQGSLRAEHTVLVTRVTGPRPEHAIAPLPREYTRHGEPPELLIEAVKTANERVHAGLHDVTLAAPPGQNPAPAVPAEHWLSATLSTVNLVKPLAANPTFRWYPEAELMIEARAHQRVGVALIGTYGAGRSIGAAASSELRLRQAVGSVQGLGYVSGNFDEGLQLGLEAGFARAHARSLVNGSEATGTGSGVHVAGLFGVKTVATSGFTFNGQIGGGPRFITASDASASTAVSTGRGVKVLLNVNLGWSI